MELNRWEQVKKFAIIDRERFTLDQRDRRRQPGLLQDRIARLVQPLEAV
jgi:hypothetical protein